MKKTRNFLTLTGHLNFIKIPSVKSLSKAVTSVLKLRYKQIETYDSRMHCFPWVKSFSPVVYKTTSLLLMQ